jgi:ketosteroid isomerase-like protein
MNRFLLCSLVLAMAACQTPTADTEGGEAPAAAAGDADAAREAIQAMSDAYEAAAQTGDAAAISALHADDALLQPAGQPAVRGRAAVDSLIAADNGEPSDLQLTTTEIIVSEAGDMAYEVGTIAAPDGAGKYLTVYRNTPEGWRIVADTWSTDSPPADTADGG